MIKFVFAGWYELLSAFSNSDKRAVSVRHKVLYPTLISSMPWTPPDGWEDITTNRALRGQFNTRISQSIYVIP